MMPAAISMDRLISESLACVRLPTQRSTRPRLRLRRDRPAKRRERLQPAARLSEKADACRIRAELRADRRDHRRGAAARGAPRLVVGDAAQPAGEDAAARGVSCW